MALSDPNLHNNAGHESPQESAISEEATAAEHAGGTWYHPAVSAPEPGPALYTLNDEPRMWGLRRSQWAVITIIVVFTVGAMIYRGLFAHNLQHTSLMFMGLPAVCALLLACAPAAKSATGAVVKGITLVLLVLAPLLGEGWFCILIASPLFYLVGVIVGLIMDSSRRRDKTAMGCVALLALVPACLEGVSPRWTVTRAATVEVRRVVHAPAADVAAALAGGMDVRVPRPLLLRFGFPAPLRSWGNGLGVGAEHGVHFAGAEGAPAGDLHLRVVESLPGYVRLEAVQDGSKLLQWTRWRTSEVSWIALDATHTAVVSRITYDRQLDPAWYFGPLERAAVRGAAGYLLDSNATPVGAR
ncbi:hypothetical protein [Terriglobus sp.]|uniref:hypothetical protein n=1 Tax=Terriglobus sp. TaxID=1889013 RepID=UPI003B00C802